MRSISSLDDHSEEGSSSTDLKHEQDDEKEEEVSSNHFFKVATIIALLFINASLKSLNEIFLYSEPQNYSILSFIF